MLETIANATSPAARSEPRGRTPWSQSRRHGRNEEPAPRLHPAAICCGPRRDGPVARPSVMKNHRRAVDSRQRLEWAVFGCQVVPPEARQARDPDKSTLRAYEKVCGEWYSGRKMRWFRRRDEKRVLAQTALARYSARPFRRGVRALARLPGGRRLACVRILADSAASVRCSSRRLPRAAPGASRRPAGSGFPSTPPGM